MIIVLCVVAFHSLLITAEEWTLSDGRFMAAPVPVPCPPSNPSDQPCLILASSSGKLRVVTPQGTELWSKTFGPYRGLPIVDASDSTNVIMYVTTTTGKAYCLETNNGHVIWEVDVPTGKDTMLFESTLSPDRSLLVIGARNDKIHVINAKKGSAAVIPPIPVNAGVYGQVVFAPKNPNVIIYTVTAANTIGALTIEDLTNPKKLWSFDTMSSVSPAAWKIRVRGWIFPGPTIFNDTLVMVGASDSQIRGFVIETGALVFSIKVPDSVGSGLVVIPKTRDFLGSTARGHIFRISLSGAKPKILWMTDLKVTSCPGPIAYDPAVAPNELYVATTRAVHRLNIHTGVVADTISIPPSVGASTTGVSLIGEKMIAVGCEKGVAVFNKITPHLKLVAAVTEAPPPLETTAAPILVIPPPPQLIVEQKIVTPTTTESAGGEAQLALSYPGMVACCAVILTVVFIVLRRRRLMPAGERVKI